MTGELRECRRRAAGWLELLRPEAEGGSDESPPPRGEGDSAGRVGLTPGNSVLIRGGPTAAGEATSVSDGS